MSEEFENIKNQIIYFDWNIINYLYNTTTLSGKLLQDIQSLQSIISNFINREKCAFPLSQGHFQDIHQGAPDLSERKLYLLNLFCKGWFIHENPAENFQLRLDKLIDIQEHYGWFVENNLASNSSLKSSLIDAKPHIDQAVKSIRDIAKLDPESPYSKILLKLADSLYLEDNGLESQRLSKEIRQQSLKDGLIKFPQVDKNIIDLSELEFFKEIEKALHISNVPIKSYEEYCSLSFPSELPILSKFQNQILKITGFCDFIGLVSEKSKKETAFKSMTTDQRHLAIGLQCNLFVSADKNLLLKAKFIKKWLKLDTLIFNIYEFIDFILRIDCKKQNQNNPSKEKICNYNFCDSNGNLIHQITIKL